uniref:Small t antigen n=2 Tax=Budgerigar fledgling disease virus TaxID=1891747 RepID=Q9IBL0_BFPYV|nr:small t antigen [Budgerigar fledgling disease virus - 4]QNR54901.1 putative small t antigen [Gammapolyomavirus avis]
MASLRRLTELLGLPVTATAADIKTAYRRTALKYHPDKGGDEEKMKELNTLMEEFRETEGLRADETLEDSDPEPEESGYATFENVSVPDIDGAFFKLMKLKKCMQTYFSVNERRKQDIRPEYLELFKAFQDVPWKVLEDFFTSEMF